MTAIAAVLALVAVAMGWVYVVGVLNRRATARYGCDTLNLPDRVVICNAIWPIGWAALLLFWAYRRGFAPAAPKSAVPKARVVNEGNKP